MSDQLSEHFSLHEFLRSDYAARKGIPLIPPPAVIDNLRRLCEDVLEPLRANIGRVITISSGWRPQWLNMAIGGAKDSAHIDGRAADVLAQGMTPHQLCMAAQALALPYDQNIQEFDQWSHLAVAKIGEVPRGQRLTATVIAGSTHYAEGFA